MQTHIIARRVRSQAVRMDQSGFYTRAEIARRCFVSRTTLYKWLARWRVDGERGLEDRPRSRPIMPNQTPLEYELAILDFMREHPGFGARRASYHLKAAGVPVGEMAVRGVLRRHGLRTRKDRFRWVEEGKPEEKTQWEIDREESKKRHLHAPEPGHIVGMDTRTVGRLLGIGRVYVFVAIDAHSRFAWADLATDKTAETAAAFLRQVAGGSPVRIARVLTDNGKEYTHHRRTEKHPFEIAAREMGIEHRLTRVRHPWTNGHAERFHATLLNEFFAVILRQRRFDSLDDLRAELALWLKWYNSERPHMGLRGKTPAQFFERQWAAG